MFLRNKADHETDEDLLSRFRSSHDLEALSTLYLRYVGLLYGVCFKYLRDREAAKDAVMQIHEKLIELVPRHEITRFRPWLYSVARNHCLMQLRNEKTHGTEQFDAARMENLRFEHPGDGDEKEMDLQKLEKCLETLSREQQACVRLFYLKEQCYQEVSENTGFEMSQVKSYIQNGKRNLKICMETR